MRLMLSAACSALALGAASALSAAETFPGDSPPTMAFAYAKADETCEDCGWIAAEGPITARTPDDWLAFIEGIDKRDLAQMRVHLNSPGGSLREALRLGDLFRLHGVTTVSSATTGERNVEDVVVVSRDGERLVPVAEDARCASACIIALAGGRNRIAASTTAPSLVDGQPIIPVSVHALSYEDGTGTAAPEAEPDLGETPAGSPAADDMLAYFTRMGVSAEILQLASLVPQVALLDMSDRRLHRAALDTHLPARLDVVGYANGVGVVEMELTRSSGSYRLELYCSGGSMKLLAKLALHHDHSPQEAEDLGLLAALHLDDRAVAVERKAITQPEEDGPLLVDVLLSFEGHDIASLVTRKDFAFTDVTSDLSGELARDLSFGLPGDFGGLYVLPPACQK